MSEDELMHFKYIKREKQPDGSYKYYYDQSELDAAGKAAKAAEAESVKANIVAGGAKHEAERAREATTFKNIGYAKSRDRIEAYHNTKQEYDKAKKTAYQASVKAKEATKKYNKMKVTSFVDRTISKGIVTVANLLSGLFGRNKNNTTGKEKRHGR